VKHEEPARIHGARIECKQQAKQPVRRGRPAPMNEVAKSAHVCSSTTHSSRGIRRDVRGSTWPSFEKGLSVESQAEI
jgi:hypothetical protein